MKSKGENDDYYNLRSEETPRKITKQQLYQFASDIARGMEFLATHQVFKISTCTETLSNQITA